LAPARPAGGGSYSIEYSESATLDEKHKPAPVDSFAESTGVDSSNSKTTSP